MTTKRTVIILVLGFSLAFLGALLTVAFATQLVAAVRHRLAATTRLEMPVRNGRVQTFWANGHVKADVTYRNDTYAGEYRTWYESGKPYELRHYTAGHEDGLQQSWTEQGELYVNYEVREGRRYGLVNSTPCTEVGERASNLPYYDSADFAPRWSPVAHRVGAFHLTRQTGERVTERSLANQVYVASFIYTRCAAVCPIVVRQLTRVQESTTALIVSYTVTPDVDTPAALAAFGRDRGVNSSRWWLVTGEAAQIYDLARTSYFADDNRASGTSFLHTEKLLLVDGTGRLRGVYNGTQPREIDLLIGDIKTLGA